MGLRPVKKKRVHEEERKGKTFLGAGQPLGKFEGTCMSSGENGSRPARKFPRKLTCHSSSHKTRMNGEGSTFKVINTTDNIRASNKLWLSVKK